MRANTFSQRLVITAIAAVAALFVACASNPGPSGTTPASNAGEAEHPDTKAAPGDCEYYNYYHNESKNSGGPGKCTDDCECDGMRSCTSGVCEGEARKKVDCNDPDRRWNEAWNPQGPGKCSDDCECSGRRTCQSGTCQGVAR